MKLLIINSLILMVTAALGAPTIAANIVLRAKSNHEGTIVVLGDVADISAATTAELSDLATTVLMPAPAPGTQQFVQRAQIRDLLAARGIDLGTITLSGAEVVEVGIARPQAELEAEKKELLPLPSRQEIEASLHASIKQYLSHETGHDRWTVATELDMASYLRLANLGSELSASGGRKPFAGKQYFQIAGEKPGQEMTVLVSVTPIQPVVTALRKIERGELIRATDLDIRQHEGTLPSTAITTLADAIGMEAGRPISEGSILLKSQLSAPLQVERGETVTVFARTAGITVRTFATANQDGAQGELVQVETLDGKEKFMARVSGRRQLEVLASGSTAGDFASLPRHENSRR